PWHLREYTADEYLELVTPHFASVELYGLFHAGKLRAHELALKAGWDRVHPALRLTDRFYGWFVPAISASDFELRREASCDLERALDFIAVCRS
ncbi:MAG: class I SAM-dependent methyltransferase, partial [Solirubrobacterales bacterium]